MYSTAFESVYTWHTWFLTPEDTTVFGEGTDIELALSLPIPP